MSAIKENGRKLIKDHEKLKKVLLKEFVALTHMAEALSVELGKIKVILQNEFQIDRMTEIPKNIQEKFLKDFKYEEDSFKKALETLVSFGISLQKR